MDVVEFPSARVVCLAQADDKDVLTLSSYHYKDDTLTQGSLSSLHKDFKVVLNDVNCIRMDPNSELLTTPGANLTVAAGSMEGSIDCIVLQNASASPETSPKRSLKRQRSGSNSSAQIPYQKLTLLGHSAAVNDVCFLSRDEEGRQRVASVSDDKTLKIWVLDMNELTFSLLKTITPSSAGLFVKSHPLHADIILVAERSGCIRLFDYDRMVWTLSIYQPGPSCISTLKSIDWYSRDPKLIGAIVGDRWYVWDLSQMPLHQYKHIGPAEHGYVFKWSKSNAASFCLLPPPSYTLNSQAIHLITLFNPNPHVIHTNQTYFPDVFWLEDSNCLMGASKDNLSLIQVD